MFELATSKCVHIEKLGPHDSSNNFSMQKMKIIIFNMSVMEDIIYSHVFELSKLQGTPYNETRKGQKSRK